MKTGCLFASFLIGVALATVAPAFEAAGGTRAGHLRVELVSDVASVRPGAPFSLGLAFSVEPGWHIYWRNSGDSGAAPRAHFTLPEGFTVHELEWPAPRRLPLGPIMNFGYEGEVLFPIAVDSAADWPADRVEGQALEFRARVEWLVCKQDCIPGSADVDLQLPIRLDRAPEASAQAERFAATRTQLPVATTATAHDDGNAILLDVVLPEATTAAVGAGARYLFFPYEPQVVEHAAAQPTEARADGVRLRLKKDETRTAPLTEIAGIVVAEGNRIRRSFSLNAALAPPAPAPAATVSATARMEEPGPLGRGGIWLALAFAFLGGVLLNLMPCVFPVLSLKIFSVVRHAHDAKRVRRHGFAYGAGILLSFWTLAGALLLLRAGSARLGWGFQLQSPGFVAVLAILLFVLALNLLGAFELGLALTRLGAGRDDGRGGLRGSFFTGVLATVVATPCTAPFMGAAMGYALAHSAPASLAVFTALALGMAAPYLALGYLPRLLARVPRPGRWMDVVRQAMAFPLFATVVWLLAVFMQLTGPDAVIRLLAGLLGLALAAWLFGRTQASEKRSAVAVLLAFAIGVGSVGVAVTSAATGTSAGRAREPSGDGLWEPWSHDRVAALRAEGRPVFVNFTAAWCISCKANEMMVFATPEIREAFAAKNVAALKADWTQQDDAIASALEEHGRAGVPLYLYYPAGRPGAPETLPSLLTKGVVLAALDSRR